MWNQHCIVDYWGWTIFSDYAELVQEDEQYAHRADHTHAEQV